MFESPQKKSPPTLLPVVIPRFPERKKTSIISLFTHKGAVFFASAIIISLAFVIFMLATSFGDNRQEKIIVPPIVEISTSTIHKEAVSKAFGNIWLEAESVVVWDSVEQRIIFKKGENIQRPIASITKVMTALAATDYLNPTSTIRISPEALATEGDSGLESNEVFSFQNLLEFMLIVSSNDASESIAEAVEEIAINRSFSDIMNTKAQSIGMNSTTFNNPSGLDKDELRGIPGPQSTALDIARLFEHILKQHKYLIESTATPSKIINSESGKIHNAINTNILSSDMPGLIGSKTGFTHLAGGNLAVIFDAGIAHPVIIVILGSSREGRFEDMKRVYNATMDYFNEKHLRTQQSY